MSGSGAINCTGTWFIMRRPYSPTLQDCGGTYEKMFEGEGSTRTGRLTRFGALTVSLPRVRSYGRQIRGIRPFHPYLELVTPVTSGIPEKLLII